MKTPLRGAKTTTISIKKDTIVIVIVPLNKSINQWSIRVSRKQEVKVSTVLRMLTKTLCKVRISLFKHI